MAMTRRQLALIHVAARQLALDDDSYRAILLRLAGVDSSAKLTREGCDAVMGYFERMGFNPQSAVGPFHGNRPGMPSPLKVQLIRELWVRFAGRADWAGLDERLLRTYRVSALRFVDDPTSNKVIGALRQMANRPKKTG